MIQRPTACYVCANDFSRKRRPVRIPCVQQEPVQKIAHLICKVCAPRLARCPLCRVPIVPEDQLPSNNEVVFAIERPLQAREIERLGPEEILLRNALGQFEEDETDLNLLRPLQHVIAASIAMSIIPGILYGGTLGAIAGAMNPEFTGGILQSSMIGTTIATTLFAISTAQALME